MSSVWQKIKDRIIKIQNSDESVKRRYLIMATIAAMIVVVGLWLIYLKTTAQPFSQPAPNQTSETQFWQIFKNGLNIVGHSIKENIQNTVSQIFKGKTITIQ